MSVPILTLKLTLLSPVSIFGITSVQGIKGDTGDTGPQGEQGTPASLQNIDDRIVVQLATEGTIRAAIDIVSDSLDTHEADTANPHSVTKAQVGLTNVDDTSDADKPVSTLTQAALDLKADLVDGLVPANQLPSYVDDVLEYANLAAFPATGTAGKIYVAIDSNLTYRWSGSAYAVLDPSLALGETSSTAYRGDRGKTAYDHSQSTGNPHGTTKSDIGLGNADNTSDVNKPISTATQTAIDLKADTTYVTAKTIRSLDYALSDQTTAIATGTPLTCRVPYAFTISSVKASLKTAQVSGSLFTLDIKKNGTSIFSTLLTFDNTEKTTTTAATAAVLSSTSLADDDELTFIVTQVGNSTAIGLVVYIIGYPT